MAGCTMGAWRSHFIICLTVKMVALDGNVEARQAQAGFHHARSEHYDGYHSTGTEQGILINC